MKVTILLFIAVIAAGTSFAQPVLDSAALCPVAGDTIISHQSDTTGILPGASGPLAIWDFSTLTDNGTDTMSYSSCLATPYCDSFAGSNLAAYDSRNFNFIYFTADKNTLSSIGGYTDPGAPIPPLYLHFTNSQDYAFFPLTYLNTHKDTSEITLSFLGRDNYHHQEDSSVCDAYGTLTLPSGVYRNVIRIHTFTYAIDSSTGVIPDTSFKETYSYADSGFHNPLLTITFDTALGKSVTYYTPKSITVIPPSPSLYTNSLTNGQTMQVYPNPATDVVNITFNVKNTTATSVVITDVTGRVMGNVDSNQLKQGQNDIRFPVSGLAAGVYIVRLTSGTESATQKIVVAK